MPSAGNVAPRRFHAHLARTTTIYKLAGRTWCREPSRATRRNAQPETHREAGDPRGWCEDPDASTVGDTSPEDAFPASSSWLAAAGVSRQLVCDWCPLSAKRSLSRVVELARGSRLCPTGLCDWYALSAKRSPPRSLSRAA